MNLDEGVPKLKTLTLLALDIRESEKYDKYIICIDSPFRRVGKRVESNLR